MFKSISFLLKHLLSRFVFFLHPCLLVSNLLLLCICCTHSYISATFLIWIIVKPLAGLCIATCTHILQKKKKKTCSKELLIRNLTRDLKCFFVNALKACGWLTEKQSLCSNLFLPFLCFLCLSGGNEQISYWRSKPESQQAHPVDEEACFSPFYPSTLSLCHHTHTHTAYCEHTDKKGNSLRSRMGIRNCIKKEVTDCLSLLFDSKYAPGLLYRSSTFTGREVARVSCFSYFFSFS